MNSSMNEADVRYFFSEQFEPRTSGNKGFTLWLVSTANGHCNTKVIRTHQPFSTSWYIEDSGFCRRYFSQTIKFPMLLKDDIYVSGTLNYSGYTFGLSCGILQDRLDKFYQYGGINSFKKTLAELGKCFRQIKQTLPWLQD